ncbi:MAG: DinB family protein [Lewinellaceae bacterium]|nr:DinB family protein [Phaeodactylibacter sp.]MCB9041425.1 DinB family protein [Lewinellaceae bacterium]
MTPSLDQRLKKMDRRLEGLLDQLSAYDNEALNRKPADGGWSALQVMHHLLLAEEGSVKYVKKKLSFNPELEPAGFSSAWRAFLLNFYFLLPLKFKAPPGVGDDVLPAQSDFKEVSDRWLASRKALREYMEGLSPDLFQKSIYRHPFAGRMSLEGMVRFFDGHFERHRKQIERVIRETAG